MSYEKHTWVNNVDAVDEDKMNHIENGIANAVEKTGDTMTGALSFNNTNSYEAIIKDRIINNINYKAKLGIGGNGSVRLELNEGSSTSGTSLEVRTNGLYNGLSGQKLLEIKTKTITNETIGAYGNIPLNLYSSSAIVLAVDFNRGYTGIPLLFGGIWYCYVVKNQAQDTLNLQTSGTISGTVYYVEF